MSSKTLLSEIIIKLLANDKIWLEDKQIIVGDKEQYWILNYNQGERNEYNKLTRSLVVQKPEFGFDGDPLSLIKSFPVTRFFNLGEIDAVNIDFNNAEMLEKLDGSFVCIFFPDGTPKFHTRKMMSTHDEDQSRTLTTFHGKKAQFIPTIQKYVDQLTFDEHDFEFTYMFEFIHEVSYVLTKYQPHQYGLYLLAARHLPSHEELFEDDLDILATKIGVRRPRRFDAKYEKTEIQKMFKQFAEETPDFEGFIFRDKATGERVKVKDPNYVEKHHLLDGLSYKNLIPRVFKGEEAEISAYFPLAVSRIQDIKLAYDRFISLVVEKIVFWREQKLERKELALKLFVRQEEPNEFIKSKIMNYFQEQDELKIKENIDQELKTIVFGRGKNIGNPKRLLELIELQELER